MKIDNRIWAVLTALVGGAVLAAAWFLGASPMLTAADASSSQTQTVSGQNKTTRAQIASLVSSQSKMGELKTELGELQDKIPAGVRGAAFIGRVQAIASQAGVTVKAIQISDPAPYSPGGAAAAAAAPQTTAGTAASPSASPSDGSTPAPTPTPTGPAAPSPKTDPLITGANFIIVPVSVEVEGGNDEVREFVRGIQHDERLILVTKVTSKRSDTGAGSGNSYDMTVGGSIFVLLPTAAAAGASANG